MGSVCEDTKPPTGLKEVRGQHSPCGNLDHGSNQGQHSWVWLEPSGKGCQQNLSGETSANKRFVLGFFLHEIKAFGEFLLSHKLEVLIMHRVISWGFFAFWVLSCYFWSPVGLNSYLANLQAGLITENLSELCDVLSHSNTY